MLNFNHHFFVGNWKVVSTNPKEKNDTSTKPWKLSVISLSPRGEVTNMYEVRSWVSLASNYFSFSRLSENVWETILGPPDTRSRSPVSFSFFLYSFQRTEPWTADKKRQTWSHIAIQQGTQLVEKKQDLSTSKTEKQIIINLQLHSEENPSLKRTSKKPLYYTQIPPQRGKDNP